MDVTRFVAVQDAYLGFRTMLPRHLHHLQGQIGNFMKLVWDGHFRAPNNFKESWQVRTPHTRRRLLQDSSQGMARIFEIPYSTAIHYIPMDVSTGSNSIAPVAVSSKSSKWQPEAITLHDRPFPMMYITTRRKGQHLDTDYLRVKAQVRVAM